MSDEPVLKKQKVEGEDINGRVKGVAPIKKEFLIERENSKVDPDEQFDDENEGNQRTAGEQDKNNNKKKKKGGRNKDRNLKQGRETIRLCANVRDTGDPTSCSYGENCKHEHDVQKYLDSKPPDVEGVCPVFDTIGYCPAGLKCRWLGSHYKDGKMVKGEKKSDEYETNKIESNKIFLMQRKKYELPKSEKLIKFYDSVKDNNAEYIEPPFKPEEKKKLNLDGKMILSPLTTVGNLPYRRLMKTLGAEHTYSEMAFSLPLLQGTKSEWALPKAHSSEIGEFGVQIAASKPWQGVKAAEVLTNECPNISELNLNCGCPIDLLYRQGAGSALMDYPSKLARILQGMSAASNDVPVTVKIRTGTKDKQPTAKNLVSKLMKEIKPAAITLHGRSRAQRYTRLADWEYIKEVADQVKAEREDSDVKTWLIGNGDTYSFVDWYDAVENSGVDSVMVARGALIKPWIFEEIKSRQYLDKSASERLQYIENFAKFGLDHWGSDDYGVNLTRRFMCEWLSFTHRYVPEGILEYLPPKINDRPDPFKGRNELETLLSSSDYKDWIKITEMFLGKASDNFEFTPKHKSNAY